MASTIVATGLLRGFLAFGCLALGACQPQQAHNFEDDIQADAGPMAGDPDAGASSDLPAGILDRHALVRFIRAADNFTPTDQFSSGFNDKSIRGRRFHIVLKSDDPRPPSFTYDTDKHRLHISQSTEYQDGFNFITLFSKDDAQPPKTESNAFGATVDVTSDVKTAFGIGSKDCRLGLFKSEDGLCSDLSKTLSIGGANARKATSGMISEIDGVIAMGGDGKAVQCTGGHRIPTISDPREVTTHTCILVARISRVVLRSPAAGVLASWSSK